LKLKVILIPFDSITIPIEIRDTDILPDKPLILLVEDNLAMANYMMKILSEKYNVFFAINGRVAIRKLDIIKKPDIILSDIMMDEMDGIALLLETKNDKRYSDIPFIFLTAKTSEFDRINGIQNGAIDYISKPFSSDELLAKIDSILRVRDKYKENIKTIINDALSNTGIEKTKKNTLENILNNNRLNETEKEIVEALYFSNMTIKQLGEKIGKAESTIRNNLVEIYKKFGVENLPSLINMIQRQF